MNRRKQQKEATRTRILEAALQLFSRRGIVATGTMDVARQAGVSHGSVFAHFSTRDELVAEVISGAGQQVMSRLHQLVENQAGVRAILSAHVAGLMEHEAFYSRLVMEGPLLPSPARNAIIAIQSAVSIHLFEAAQRESSLGQLRSMPLALLFNTWIGLLHHYLANRDLFAPGESVLAVNGAQLVDHFMALLAP